MASSVSLKVSDVTEICKKAIQQDTGTAFDSDDIVPDRDCTIDAILIQKNTAVQVDVDLIIESDGITITVDLLQSAAGVTSGIYLEDRHIPVPAGGIIRFDSSLSTTDEKKALVLARPRR